MTSQVVFDGCSGQGGAAAGYLRAGAAEVVGFDLRAAHGPYYPGTQFFVADVLAVLEDVDYMEQFTFAHVSPPCQGYSRGNAGRVTDWPLLIAPMRERLLALGIPFVIENVKDAAWDMVNPVTLCGCMFGLSAVDDDGILLHMLRPRLFEAHGFALTPPRACDHSGMEWIAGAYGGARRDKYEAKYVRKGGYVPPNKTVVAALLGIEHNMTWNGLFESIPPAYTEHVFRSFLTSETA